MAEVHFDKRCLADSSRIRSTCTEHGVLKVLGSSLSTGLNRELDEDREMETAWRLGNFRRRHSWA